MADKFMTMEELRTMKVRELPNMVYAEVIHQLAIRFGKSLENSCIFSMKERFTNLKDMWIYIALLQLFPSKGKR